MATKDPLKEKYPKRHQLTRQDSIKGGKNQKRGYSIKTRWEKLLKSNIPAELKKNLASKGLNVSGNAGDILALIALQKALEGDHNAMKLVIEQLDGKAKEKVELTGDEKNPVKFVMEWPKD